ncbi:DNA-processing protein DprA [Novosphingobium rosa]|uniref:DNA-processing protein DprA n=1 Tax=Novosphingobium rosa TaxID=76978 RepID=UPI0008343B63|nr:DNA-processing protein DprA [Novosphingobium rosa]
MGEPAPSARKPSGLTREEGVARIRLIRSGGIGPVNYHQLLARFGSASAALEALPGLGKAGFKPFSVKAVEAEMAAVRAAGGRYLFHDGADYPALLALAEGTPPILIVRGDPAMAARRPVAIVGARNASAGAMKLARMLARDLAGEGCAVISGLARGVDAAAHEGALSAENSAGTVGVIAGGIDIAYPPEHAALQERIAREGLLISEMPPGTEPTQRHFPARNRIIAGLAMGTVVVEAAPKSGSLITARLAGDYGRAVMAVPGSPLDPRAHGGNDLIREGAVLVQRIEDILELLTDFQGAPRMPLRAPKQEALPLAVPDAAPIPQPPAGDSADERIAALLGVAPIGVDDLIRHCGLPAGVVQAALIDMELTGRIIRHAGGRVSRAV